MEGIDFEYRLGSYFTFSFKLVNCVNYITIKMRDLFLFLIILRQGYLCKSLCLDLLLEPYDDCGIEIDW